MLAGIEIVAAVLFAVATVIGRRAVRRLLGGRVWAAGGVRRPARIAGHFSGAALLFAGHLSRLHLQVSATRAWRTGSTPVQLMEPGCKRERLKGARTKRVGRFGERSMRYSFGFLLGAAAALALP